jgi:RNA polymerase sigma-70 factor (family 1)
MPTLNDEDLIRELKAGNMSAFKELFDDYSSLVFNVALRMLQNKEDAEDITQDTFLQSYVSIKNFRSEARLSTWLYRIAVNTSLNFQRKRKRERWLSLDFGSDESEDPREVASTDANPQDNLERNEIELVVQKAINSLPKKQRISLLLYRYEGLSYEEIAKVMNVSVPSVESRLHRAKQALAVKLIALRPRD